MAVKIATKNLRELQKAMKYMETAIEREELNPILVEALNIMRTRAVEILRGLGVKELTGTLINSLITKASKSTKYAGAWLKADAVKKTGADNARHAHLIEFGHELWKGGKKRQGMGHSLGKNARAFPFFRPALDQTRARMRKWINDGIKRLLKSAAMRAGFADNGSSPDDTGWIG